jgi:hypothetical protein
MHKKGISEVSLPPFTNAMGRWNGCAPSYDISRIARCVQMAMSAAPIPSKTPGIAPLRANTNRSHHTGSRQEAYPPHSQAPACHRRCFPRRHQGAPFPAPRGPCRRPFSRRPGRKGEEGCRRVKEEGREGQERFQRCARPGIQDPEQAGLQGCRTQGPGIRPSLS